MDLFLRNVIHRQLNGQRTISGRRALPGLTQAVRKHKKSSGDKNDVLRFDVKIKLACDVGT